MMEDKDYQTTEHVKVEVVDYGFVEVSQDEHQLCTACLCATRTTRTLDDDALKQYYMHILTEMQPEGGVVVLQSPRVCWECVSHLKRAVHFREQVQDSYRLLQPTLSMCDREDLDEFLQSSVCRPERLKTCVAHSIDISPQDDDMLVMTAVKRDDEDDQKLTATVKVEVKQEKDECDWESTEEIKQEMPSSSHCEDRGSADLDVQFTHSNYEYYNPNAPEEKDAPSEKDVESEIKPNAHTEKRGYQCKVCFKTFVNKAHVTRHMRSHTAEKPYVCPLCPQAFSQRQVLDAHIITHTGDKRYQCDVCERAFSRKGDVTDHIRIHTGEKPYQCKVCSRKFSHRGNLREHTKTHTGDKVFECEVCSKAFLRKGVMLRHLHTHTGYKPYKCEMCPKQFSRKQLLSNHYFSKHGRLL